MADEIEKVQELLSRVEGEAEKVGLHVNAKNISTKAGKKINVVDNFKYLGAWMTSSEKDNVRKALAWKACQKLAKIWKSPLQKSIKIKVFID